MTRFVASSLLTVFFVLRISAVSSDGSWTVDTAEEWQLSARESENLAFEEGLAVPSEDQAAYRSVLRRFPKKRSAQSMVLAQSPAWQNWEPVKNMKPVNLYDAPVLLSLAPDNYWIFGRYNEAWGVKKGNPPPAFTPQSATLEGFDIPLQTTRFPRQFDAPGGLKKKLGGYHAWQSRDMVNWVHHGPVTETFSAWVTTAEYADGKAYIYYDFPNDQDPHVYVDDDLTDGLPGKNMGMAFEDPSDGSDCAVIRDLEGRFHVIYEDWSPIMASKRSWDSPLAGHAVSLDGLGDFTILSPAVDERTEPTGVMKTYNHPHWAKEAPERFKTGKAEYEVHTPEQEAFGDWASICIGGQYYLFGDYDPEHGKVMSIAWFTSSSINEPFSFCGNIGKGHPDPDICFAEGQFYLVNQTKNDYVSPGPWVGNVEARVGVDEDNNGEIDTWTDWQEVQEQYGHTKGFAKQVERIPASLDLRGLPAGFGFSFEFRVQDTTENNSKPVIDRVTLTWDAMN
jgi:hypothetical protein